MIFIRCIQKECDCQDKEEIELSFNRSVPYSFMTTIWTLMDAHSQITDEHVLFFDVGMLLVYAGDSPPQNVDL